MAKENESIIFVQGLALNIISQHQDNYILITDIAMLWEQLRNPHLNSMEFDGIKIQMKSLTANSNIKRSPLRYKKFPYGQTYVSAPKRYKTFPSSHTTQKDSTYEQ